MIFDLKCEYCQELMQECSTCIFCANVLCPGPASKKSRLELLEEAVKEFLVFKHPREGSDKYHKAWENLETVFNRK